VGRLQIRYGSSQISSWSSKDLRIEFHPDVNFLIGTNGSGKTTIINLIAAALTADIPTLDRIRFQSIELQLVNPERPKDKARALVAKEPKPDSLTPNLAYAVSIGEQSFNFVIGPLERRTETSAFLASRHVSAGRTGLADLLHRFFYVSWLSIHRAPIQSVRGTRSYESSVDKKLDELGNSLTRLFSEISSRGESETRIFEQSMFLSLLPRGEQWELFNSVKELDLNAERNALVEILGTFGLNESEFQQVVDEHFQLVTSAVAKDSWDNKELLALGAMWSIHQVVQGWRALRAKQGEIYRPREDFLRILNEMIHNKRMAINERNELYAIIGSAKKLSLPELSSGEKQLVIILGEALLQKQSASIYIADEPELSLHVSWQEKLTSNLRQVNPNAQVIFATHSPDIVSTFRDHIFDLEKLLA
jgi:predicted ATPase